MATVGSKLMTNRLFSIRFKTLLILAILATLIFVRGTIPAADTALPRTQQVPASTPQVVDSLGRPVASPRVGDLITIEATVANNDTADHTITYVVQIKDSTGVVVSLGWIGGISLTPGSSLKPAVASTITAPGTYVAEVYILTTIAEGIPLSPVKRMNFTVSA